ncbi:hypothetical protein KAR91_15950 [Candidatus Pacearchaeota archaeon]|nr:hypothetical protein [Candidatus Pacearchaeota archaeon]
MAVHGAESVKGIKERVEEGFDYHVEWDGRTRVLIATPASDVKFVGTHRGRLFGFDQFIKAKFRAHMLDVHTAIYNKPQGSVLVVYLDTPEMIDIFKCVYKEFKDFEKKLPVIVKKLESFLL